MIGEEAIAGFDFRALRGAMESADPDVLIGFYSEAAELRVVNAALPDGPTFELKGKAQIERYLRAVCDQQMSCLLEEEVVFGEGSVEFVEVCTYPEGTPILVRTTLELAGSLIMRQTDVVELAGGDDTNRGGGH